MAIRKREDARELLKSVGAVFERKHKHEIWRLPNRKIVVVAGTPGDTNANVQTCRMIRRMLRD